VQKVISAFTIICPILLFTSASSTASDSICQTTNPKTSQVVVPWKNQHHPGNDSVWFGTESLAALLPPDGTWTGFENGQAFGTKIWFWSKNWNSTEELRPALKVYAQKTNDKTLKSESLSATQGHAADWQAMLTGIGLPTPGCWKISAYYKESNVSFVVNVHEYQQYEQADLQK